MLTVFSAFHFLELAAKVLTGFLVLTVVACGAIIVFTFPLESAGHRRLPIKSIVTYLLSVMVTFWVFVRIDVYAVIIQRLGHFSGALESLAHLHAALFVCLVIATSARAFFVVGEMDLGRYAGEEEVPSIVGRSRRHKVAEAVARGLIILLLTGFAFSFFKVVIPASDSDFAVIGQPAVVGDLSKQCADYKEVISRGGFGDSKGQCVRGRLSELFEDDTRSLALLLTEPIEALLLPTYAIMVLWCWIVWAAAKSHVSNPPRLRKALLLQFLIAGLSFLSAALMVTWIGLAVRSKIPVLQVASSEAFQKGALTVLSGLGVILVIGCLCVLTLRLNSDRLMLIALAQRRRLAHERADNSNVP